MKPHEELPSLKALEDNIHRVRGSAAPMPPAEPSGAMQGGMKMGAQFASGVLAGGAVGFFLDRWLGTSPVLFIVCFLLGAAGGFLTLYRTMTAMDKNVSAAPAPAAADDDDD